jgi:hypothetical protein
MTATLAAVPGRRRAGLRAWWFTPVPLGRVAALRTVLYLFVIYDITRLVNDVVAKGDAPVGLYQPVLIPRVLGVPAPAPVVVRTVHAILWAGCLVAATGRLPRLAGYPVAVAFLYWLFVDMSYGKIDHDHFALTVALFVLPTVGRARHSDDGLSEAAGWAMRCIQIGVIATYFLAAFAKLRWGGWGWPNGATFYWAMSRRGTDLGRWVMVHAPVLLIVGQWVVLIAEFASIVLLFVRGRARLLGALFFLSFHLLTYLTIHIHFLPTVVCWLAFTPLERVYVVARRMRAGAAGLGGQGTGRHCGERVARLGEQSGSPGRSDGEAWAAKTTLSQPLYCNWRACDDARSMERIDKRSGASEARRSEPQSGA